MTDDEPNGLTEDETLHVRLPKKVAAAFERARRSADSEAPWGGMHSRSRYAAILIAAALAAQKRPRGRR